MPDPSRRATSDLGAPLRFTLTSDARTCRLCQAGDHQRTVCRESHLGSGQSLRRCGVCAAVYLAPDFTAESLDLFYRDHYRRLFPSETVWRSERRFFAWRGDAPVARVRLARIARHLPPGSHLFEMGPGFGAFLGAAAALDGVRLSASEPDTACRTRLVGAADVQFLSGIEALPAGSIDVVVAFHVLEHLPEPGAFLKAALLALRPGGRAFVEVPDLMKSLRAASDVHPAHLSYFSIDTLSRLAEAAGFRIHYAGRHPDGGVLADNIWLEIEKPTQPRVAAPLKAASREEVAAVDAVLDAVAWEPSRGQRWRRFAKRTAVRMLGAGAVGELQRFRQWRHLRRVGWT